MKIGEGLDQVAEGWAYDVVAVFESPALKNKYEITSYTWSISAAASATAATTGLAVERGQISNIDIQVKRSDTAPSLMANVFSGKPLGDVTLYARPKRLKDGSFGAPEKFIVLTGVTIEAAASSSSSTYISEGYSLRFATAEIRREGVSVKFDLPKGVALLSGECKAQPYIDSATELPLEANAKAIHSVSVGVASVFDPLRGASKPVLSGVAMSAKLEQDGLCAAYNAYMGGKPVAATRIAVQGPELGKNLIEWDLCQSVVRGVSFSGSADYEMEALELDAQGLVRTDRSFDAYGKETSKNVTGWSFVKNMPVAACW